MCGPVLAWDWLILDIAYGLTLLGGGLILRTSIAAPGTWVAFGLLASVVGAVLFYETFAIQTAAAAAPDTAMNALKGVC